MFLRAFGCLLFVFVCLITKGISLSNHFSRYCHHRRYHNGAFSPLLIDRMKRSRSNGCRLHSWRCATLSPCWSIFKTFWTLWFSCFFNILFWSMIHQATSSSLSSFIIENKNEKNVNFVVDFYRFLKCRVFYYILLFIMTGCYLINS